MMGESSLLVRRALFDLSLMQNVKHSCALLGDLCPVQAVARATARVPGAPADHRLMGPSTYMRFDYREYTG